MRCSHHRAALQRLPQLLRCVLPVENDLLSEDFDLSLDRKHICTTARDFNEFKDKYPLWRMPYALPGLADEERDTIVSWLRQGARITPKPPLSDQAAGAIGPWEEFLEGASFEEQLMSRYLYEHLFIGRIHFESLPR